MLSTLSSSEKGVKTSGLNGDTNPDFSDPGPDPGPDARSYQAN